MQYKTGYCAVQHTCAALPAGLKAISPQCCAKRLLRSTGRLDVHTNALWHNRMRTPFRPGLAAAQAPAAGPPANVDQVAKIDHVALVKQELVEHRKVMVAQVAPAVRVTIGEELGLPVGTSATGQLVAALRLLGFDYVFDVLAGADITILEEGTELIHRLRDNLDGNPGAAPLPMFTSCCPGWIEFVEKCAPELIPYVSSAKSPHMMAGTLIKTYFADMLGRAPQDLSVVSIMPCVRKQGEADRVWFQLDSGAREVDHVLTTRDCAALLKERGLDFGALPADTFDAFLGLGSGAAALFGTTGGVMEAALRTVVELAGGQELAALEYVDVRGFAGIKEAEVTIPANPEGPLANAAPVTLRVAVANGLSNAKMLLDAVLDGTSPYAFIEVMACPGGCIGGGGQPRSKEKDILPRRQAALYSEDERTVVRRSHQNPVVQQIYAQLGGEPGSEQVKKLLHTRYVECGPPKFDLNAPPPPHAAGDWCHLPPAEECGAGEEEICEAGLDTDQEASCCFDVP